MMKHLLFTFFTLWSASLFAQTITYSTGALNPVPNQVYWFEFQEPSGGSDAGCQYDWSLFLLGEITTSTGAPNGPIDQKRVYVVYSNIANNNGPTNPKVLLTVSVCSTAAYNKIYELTVNPKYLPAPIFTTSSGTTITSTNLPCYESQLTLRVAAIAEAEEYKWELPAGWRQSGTSNTTVYRTLSPMTLVVAPENTVTATLKASGVTGSFTGPSTNLTVTRNSDALAFTGVNPVVYCISSDPVTYSVNNIPGHAYSWTYPSGWTCVTGCNTNQITLQPNGTNVAGQNVVATATISCGGQPVSVTASRAISYSTATPPTALVEGPGLICSPGATYTLANVINTLPVTWEVNALLPSSGTGGSAFIKPETRRPIVVGGWATLTFNVGGACNTNVTKTIWYGPPTITYFPTPPGHNICTSAPRFEAPNVSDADYLWESSNPSVWVMNNGSFLTQTTDMNGDDYDLTVTMSVGSCVHTTTLEDQVGNGLYCICFQDDACENQQLMSVYPNPANGYVNLTLGEPGYESKRALSSPYAYSVFNSSGHEVMRGTSTAKTIQLDTKNLPAGMYIIRTNIKGKIALHNLHVGNR